MSQRRQHRVWRRNWTEIAEDERASDEQMEAVAGNLSIRLDHVEENPAEMEDF